MNETSGAVLFVFSKVRANAFIFRLIAENNNNFVTKQTNKLIHLVEFKCFIFFKING